VRARKAARGGRAGQQAERGLLSPNPSPKKAHHSLRATLTHKPSNTATAKQGLAGAAGGVVHLGAFL